MTYVLEYIDNPITYDEMKDGVVYILGNRNNPIWAYFNYEHDDCNANPKCKFHKVPMHLDGGSRGWKLTQKDPPTFDTSITSNYCNLHISIINGEVVKH